MLFFVLNKVVFGENVWDMKWILKMSTDKTTI